MHIAMQWVLCDCSIGVTVVLGVSQPRLVTAVTEICDCMLHDLRPCQKEVQHTLSFTLIRWNEEHKMTATGCIYSMLPHPLQWGFCHLDTEGVDWHIDMVLLHEEEPNGRWKAQRGTEAPCTLMGTPKGTSYWWVCCCGVKWWPFAVSFGALGLWLWLAILKNSIFSHQ